MNEPVTTQGLREALSRFESGRVLVVGDVMVDRYHSGDVSRLSPEAPVPVVDVRRVRRSLGGAANVAAGITAQGGSARLVGLVGDDADADDLVELLGPHGVEAGGLVRDPSRPTTVKTRVEARGQQIVRVDRESRDLPTAAVRAKVLEVALGRLDECDALLFEDYDKGALAEDIISPLIEAARKSGKPVTADPKFRNFHHYRGVTVFKPNQYEVEKTLGIDLALSSGADACAQIRKRLACDAVLLTRGHRGMLLDDAAPGGPLEIATSAREVFDVSGAGDTVIATLTLALAAGASLRVGTVLASVAAGIEVGKRGVATVSPEEILEWLGPEDLLWAE